MAGGGGGGRRWGHAQYNNGRVLIPWECKSLSCCFFPVSWEGTVGGSVVNVVFLVALLVPAICFVRYRLTVP